MAVRAGLLLALVSAASFALSGALARGLIDVGWSPGAVVLARIAIAALVVAPLASRALRGRWGVLRRNARIVLLYGVVPVAGTQFAYFSAVAAMDVGPALLIEYTAPAAIVVWLWLRRGERPRAADARGRGRRRRRARARARPAVGRRPGPGRSPMGARGDARRRDVLRHVRRHAQRRATARPGGRRSRGGLGRPRSARPHRRPADARHDRRADVCRRSRPLVAAVRRPRRRHRGHRLHDRHRGEPAARLAAGLLRRAARGRRGGHLRLAAARPAPGRCCSSSAARSSWSASSSSSSASAHHARTPALHHACARQGSRSRPARWTRTRAPVVRLHPPGRDAANRSTPITGRTARSTPSSANARRSTSSPSAFPSAAMIIP